MQCFPFCCIFQNIWISLVVRMKWNLVNRFVEEDEFFPIFITVLWNFFLSYQCCSYLTKSYFYCLVDVLLFSSMCFFLYDKEVFKSILQRLFEFCFLLNDSSCVLLSRRETLSFVINLSVNFFNWYLHLKMFFWLSCDSPESKGSSGRSFVLNLPTWW